MFFNITACPRFFIFYIERDDKMKKRFFLFTAFAMLLLTPSLFLTGCGENFVSGLLGGDEGKEGDVTPQQPAGRPPPPTLGSAFDADDRATGELRSDDTPERVEILIVPVWLQRFDDGTFMVVTDLPAKQNIYVLVRISHWAHPEDEVPFMTTLATVTIRKNASFSQRFSADPLHWTRAVEVSIEPFKALEKLPLPETTSEGIEIEAGTEFTARYRSLENNDRVVFFHRPE